jgi:rod shape-determining protein MreD
VNSLRIVLTIILALLVQTTLARVLVRGPVGIDVVLVAVVYLALSSGPTIGLLSGTIAGLAQDSMGTGVVGIGSLAKTVIGLVAGVVGAQFIMARPLPRFIVFFVASVVEALLVLGMQVALNIRQFGVPVAAITERALGNAFIGIALMQTIEMVPRVVERRRLNRARARTVRLR